ncbi:MAG: hypothetical protein EOO89_07860 [Pedobacter sp.]|nr:MAG: hypothetical protein EOO89_07860 [Pedobacter sp.]
MANGSVQLAPKRAEFLTTPPPYFDSQDWLNNLAVHELRHMAQFDKLTGGRHRPFPEEIYFAYMGIAVPTWFFEGDAVTIETALTNAGRGKQPNWIMPYRSQLLSDRKVSYSKAYFGSEKDVSIGYYQMGYLMASNIRAIYGKDIFNTLLTDITNRPLRLYPFSASLKKLTGKNTFEWYNDTKDKAIASWRAQQEQTAHRQYRSLNNINLFETNYFLPVRLNADSIISIRQTKADAPSIVLTDAHQNDAVLIRIGYQEQPWLSYSNNLVVWDEIRTDPRFRQRSYSVVCSYDLTSKRYRQLSHRTKYYSPSLSPSGEKIIAVTVDLSNKFSFVELNAKDGRVLRKIQPQENEILQMPSYNKDASRIVFVSVTEKGKSIRTMDLATGAVSTLLINLQQQLSRPVFSDDQILFNAHFNGIDNVYTINLLSGKIYALTAAQFGAFNASVSGDGKIIFNNYLSSGYNISETAMNMTEPGKNAFVYLGSETTAQENTGNVFDSIPNLEWKTEKYAAFSGLINFHSISPDVNSNDDAGLVLRSDNLLNTFHLYTGAYLNRSANRMEYSAGFALKAFYPVISAQYTNRPQQTYYPASAGIQRLRWRENIYTVKASLPFSFSALNDNFGIGLSMGTSYTKRYADQQLPINTDIQFPLEYSVTFNHATRTAQRDVAPRWGQFLAFSAFHLPPQGQLSGELFAFRSNFYFPGLYRNHSFSAALNYQKANGVYRYNNEIPEVYGYGQFNAISPLKNTLLLNYRFPLAFPDKELGSVAYIRNVRGGAFIHYENIGNETNMGSPKTFGIEFRSSMNLFRYLPVVDLGARLIFVNKKYNQDPLVEFILNFDL